MIEKNNLGLLGKGYCRFAASFVFIDDRVYGVLLQVALERTVEFYTIRLGVPGGPTSSWGTSEVQGNGVLHHARVMRFVT